MTTKGKGTKWAVTLLYLGANGAVMGQRTAHVADVAGLERAVVAYRKRAVGLDVVSVVADINTLGGIGMDGESRGVDYIDLPIVGRVNRGWALARKAVSK